MPVSSKFKTMNQIQRIVRFQLSVSVEARSVHRRTTVEALCVLELVSLPPGTCDGYCEADPSPLSQDDLPGVVFAREFHEAPCAFHKEVFELSRKIDPSLAARIQTSIVK